MRDSAQADTAGSSVAEQPRQARGLAGRLLSRHAAAMLVRNTVVSCLAFVFDLILLWALVRLAGWGKLEAAALGFVAANTLHYALGRSWIFRGTERGIAEGYVYFLINSAIGLFVTITLYAAFLRFTPIHYILARVVVSVFAGLTVFVLNAILNFRRL
jgi:putative flippase GtrA